MIRKHFRLKRIVLGLAFAALVAPAAQATPYGGGVGSRIGPELSAQVSPYELGSGRATHVLPSGMTLAAPIVVRSENRLGARGRSAAATGPVAVPVVSTASSDGFDWSDAAIGASAAFGVALLLLTAMVLGRKYRSRLDRTGLAST